MSEQQKRRDNGMTLVELLVSVLVIGAIVTVLAAAVTVTFRSQGSTKARLDVARWEQSLALWLPNDLASAKGVSALPGDPPPCASTDCMFGSNALQLTWDDGLVPPAVTTTISYRYGPATDGSSFILMRVECTAGSCSSLVVLRDLAGPVDLDGNPVPWTDGDPVPPSVIDVTVPLAADPNDSTAKRVIVNVNGVPGSDGVVRSSRVSFTAGGTTLNTLALAEFDDPNFRQANSDCGGPITLVVDRSGSISSGLTDVKKGVQSFVSAFDGTPTQLQIVTFSTVSDAMGPGTAWNKTFDLSEQTDVTALIGDPDPNVYNDGLVGGITANGGTNWEDALFRTFYSSNGTPYNDPGNPIPAPELVVFFTDGVPTFDREYAKSDTASTSLSIDYPYNHTTAGNKAYGSDYSPRGWFRADHILDQFRGEADTKVVGVGVGDAFFLSTPVKRSGWPSSGSTYVPIPNEAFLGDLVQGNTPHTYDGVARYDVAYYDEGSDTWDPTGAADLLVTNKFQYLGSALTQIALDECGGTLTVQTRDQANLPADANVEYQVGDETAKTTRIAKSATFDIDLSGISSKVVNLVPESLSGSGYTAQGWGCRARGVDLEQGAGKDFDLITPGDPSAGIWVEVSANAAVACTLRVSP